MIQAVIYMMSGESRSAKDQAARQVTDALTASLQQEGPVEVWFREYQSGQVFLGKRAI